MYLFAHGTLVGVPGGLVVMRIGNEARDGTKNRERLNLQVRRGGYNVCFIERNVGVVFFVDVEVFDQTLLEKVVKHELARLQLLHSASS